MSKPPKNLNTSWRKTASAIYGAPKDSKLYGSVEIDITDLEKFLSAKRKDGIKISVTQVLALVVGKVIANEVPELNTFIRRGNVVSRKTVDANITVLMKSGQLGAVKIESIDKMNLGEVSEYFNGKLEEVRNGAESKVSSNKFLLARIPWPFRRWVFKTLKWLAVDQGFPMKRMGLSPNSFGSFILSNIGSLGLDVGYGALMPGSALAMAMFIGKSEKKPVVIRDQIEIRKMLTLSVTLDHRMVDAQHGGKLLRGVSRLINDIEKL